MYTTCANETIMLVPGLKLAYLLSEGYLPTTSEYGCWSTVLSS